MISKIPITTNPKRIALQSVAKSEGWDAFKYCVRNEMKTMMKSAN